MSKKERIEKLERRLSHLADLIDIIISQDPDELARIESIEQRLDYLETMVRHCIALYEHGQGATTPTIVPHKRWPSPIPPGGLNIPYPYPFDTTSGEVTA